MAGHRRTAPPHLITTYGSIEALAAHCYRGAIVIPGRNRNFEPSRAPESTSPPINGPTPHRRDSLPTPSGPPDHACPSLSKHFPTISTIFCITTPPESSESVRRTPPGGECGGCYTRLCRVWVQGMSSLRRVILWSAMRASTSVSQAWGSTVLSFAVSIRL